ncbi:MAG: hypothetical protein JWN70_2260 [Planctomycetaceae bacterium]|nr:hypothetical protein [Planctomycetaceae bacterium]
MKELRLPELPSSRSTAFLNTIRLLKAIMQILIPIGRSLVFACQQYAGSYPRLVSSSGVETWQLVAGLEAALILVLFVGWLHATRGATTRKPDGEGDESP